MQSDDRTVAREQPGTRAWIRFDGGFPVRACVVIELSGTGARIRVDEPHTVANQFSLLLSRDANPGRRCRVKWRQGQEIGAAFI